MFDVDDRDVPRAAAVTGGLMLVTAVASFSFTAASHTSSSLSRHVLSIESSISSHVNNSLRRDVGTAFIS